MALTRQVSQVQGGEGGAGLWMSSGRPAHENPGFPTGVFHSPVPHGIQWAYGCLQTGWSWPWSIHFSWNKQAVNHKTEVNDFRRWYPQIWMMSTSKLRCEARLSRHNLRFVTLRDRNSSITKASNGIRKGLLQNFSWTQASHHLWDHTAKSASFLICSSSLKVVSTWWIKWTVDTQHSFLLPPNVISHLLHKMLLQDPPPECVCSLPPINTNRRRHDSHRISHHSYHCSWLLQE